MTQIQDLAHQLLGTAKPAPAAPTGPSPSTTVDAINASGRGGQAAAVQRVLTSKGFTPGMASTGPRTEPDR
ncbi:MAG: LytR C-terminal domain-containing protein [Pseudonocardiaceae bacterium]